MKILLLDNFDSFTYNLVHLVEQFDDTEVHVVRNDAVSFDEAEQFDKIILSPGPGIPDEAGKLKPFIREFAQRKSILGVCLGLQAIAEAFGAKLERLPKVSHGVAKETIVANPPDLLFRDIPEKFNSGRYHSWIVSEENLPEAFRITARDDDHRIMALRHRELRVCGVQFHPESILSSHGKQLMANWLYHESDVNIFDGKS